MCTKLSQAKKNQRETLQKLDIPFHSSVCSETNYFLKYLALVKQTECHEEMKICAFAYTLFLTQTNKQCSS